VVFDIGGVLLDWQPRLAYRELIPDPDELDWFLANVCTTEWNLTLDAGRPFDEACAELTERHPDQAERIQAWRNQDVMIAGEVPGTADLVRRLKDRGVPLHLLTNMPADVFRARLAAHPVLQLFDGAVVSGDEGILKPEAGLFRVLLDRFGLEPASTLFVDDSEVNVEGARAVGLQTHRFVDAERLEKALTDHGLL